MMFRSLSAYSLNLVDSYNQMMVLSRPTFSADHLNLMLVIASRILSASILPADPL